jgi:hypothetical protein
MEAVNDTGRGCRVGIGFALSLTVDNISWNRLWRSTLRRCGSELLALPGRPAVTTLMAWVFR